MKPQQFTESRTGRLISVSGPNVSHAFLPDALPPEWTWPEDLWPLLLDAHKRLASLDGTGKHLPNPRLLLGPLRNREAQKSSSLEGTYTDPKQQVLFDLDPFQVPSSKDDPINARREVANYTRALRVRLESKDSLPLSLRLIRQLHTVLMGGVRGSDKNPGEFRRVQNQVGRPARYVPPPPNHLSEALDHLERYLHRAHSFDPLVNAFLVHYQFEAIHPFMDGNGRVGRLLLAITIAEWCGLADQWLYMSAFFDRNKDEYIDRLFRVSTHGDWRGWVEFCLRGVVEQASDTIARCDRLIALYRDFHDRLKTIKGSMRLATIVDDLFVTPAAVVSWTADKTKVTYPTAKKDLEKLKNAKILTRMRNVPQIAYICMPILDLTYAD